MNEGRREIDFLKWKLSEVEKENAELKKQLNKKTAPPTGTRVRSIKHGRVGFSLGSLNGMGSLHVSSSNLLHGDWLFEDWEEIEIKVKE